MRWLIVCFIFFSCFQLTAEELFSISWQEITEVKSSSDRDFLGPQAIAVGDNENIYVLCNFAKKILVFSSSGEMINSISYDAEGCGLAVAGESIVVFSPMGKKITFVSGEHQGTVKEIESLPAISEVWFENNNWFARSGWQVVPVFSEGRNLFSISNHCFPISSDKIAVYGTENHTIFTTKANTSSSVPFAHANSLEQVYTSMLKDGKRKLFLCSSNSIQEGIVVERSKIDVFSNSYVKNNLLYQLFVDDAGITVDCKSLNWKNLEVQKEQTRGHIEPFLFQETVADVTIQNVPTYIDVFFRNEGVVRTVRLQDYLKNVVSAEIYGSWTLEAHKAMAVAARTYTIGRKRHSDAQICTSTHCQAWKADVNSKASQAVDQTNGVAIYHNGKVISEALYFAHCNGHTRNSEEKWNYNPYLRSKVCSCGHGSYYGHGVGACQYGLESYSKLGWSYKQILEHYYTGTIVK